MSMEGIIWPRSMEIQGDQFCLFKFSKTVLPIRDDKTGGADVHGCSVPTYRNLGFAQRPRTALWRRSRAGDPARGQALSGPDGGIRTGRGDRKSRRRNYIRECATSQA